MPISKEADINKEIERLRHRATRSLLLRKDVIIVASVMYIRIRYSEDYVKGVIDLEVGKTYNRTRLLLSFEKVQYERNDIDLEPGKYRIKGETIDIFPSWENLFIV